MAKAESIQDRLLSMGGASLWDVLIAWLQTYHLAIGGTVVLVMLLAGGSFYWQYQKTADLESLRRGIFTFQGGDAQKAVDELQRIQQSSIAPMEKALGLFYLGEAYVTLGRKEEAVKSYESALAAIKGREARPYFEQLLTMRAAQAIESTGTERADVYARKKYEQAVELEGPLGMEALASARRLAEKMNDRAAVKAYDEKLSSMNPTHPLAEVYRERGGR